MYARHVMMNLYLRAQRWGAFAWKVVQIFTLAYVLYMALSMIYVGIVRDAEDRGAERKKIENFETHKKLNAQDRQRRHK